MPLQRHLQLGRLPCDAIPSCIDCRAVYGACRRILQRQAVSKVAEAADSGNQAQNSLILHIRHLSTAVWLYFYIKDKQLRMQNKEDTESTLLAWP